MFAALELATALIERDGDVLLVASRYPNIPEPLWHLPGGRRRNGESFEAAAVRELFEETGMRGSMQSLAFVSESFDREADVHVVNLTFVATSADELKAVRADAHVVDAGWFGRREALERIAVPVVREPIAAYFRGDPVRYYRFADSGISIDFADDV